MSQQSSIPMRKKPKFSSCKIQTKDISQQQSIKQSFLTFQTNNSTPAKSSETDSADPPHKTARFLSIITRSKKESRNKFGARVEEKRGYTFFQTTEALCLCIPHESQKFLPRIKELRSMRQDLSSLIRSKVEEEEAKEGKNITPINSLLNLLEES